MFEIKEIEKLINQALTKALNLFSDNRHDEADTVLRQILRVDAENMRAMQLIGLIYYKNRQYQEAIEWFNKAINADLANQHENYNNLGLAYSGLGQYKKAIEYITQATNLASDNQNYLSNLGIQYRSLGD